VAGRMAGREPARVLSRGKEARPGYHLAFRGSYPEARVD
jgi:hypothetical protein